jgi:hypothetical protein
LAKADAVRGCIKAIEFQVGNWNFLVAYVRTLDVRSPRATEPFGYRIANGEVQRAGQSGATQRHAGYVGKLIATVSMSHENSFSVQHRFLRAS